MENTSGINENSNNNTCVVCYKNVEIYSIGMCEHPVCYECSTRMRVLCQQNECPICRQDLPKVIFTRTVKPYRHLDKGSLVDNRYEIYFESPDIQEKFSQLLAHTCTLCEEKQVFNSFASLKDHMRRKHELHYCDLCINNLKIFSHERRCYTRSDLAQHRRKGDLDDKSHKGHPLCQFCDQRYMDNDELYRHLRRDHLYCHFCDADGLHQYYCTYDYLRDHFRQEHYLCEEGPCADEKFTSVFRTDIDLRAHKASVHGKQLGKAAAKQARTLELEFTLAPRNDSRNNRRGPMPSTSRNTRDFNGGRDYNSREFQAADDYYITDNEPTFVRQPSVDVQSTQEFPTLGNSTPFVPNMGQSKGRGNVTIRSTLRPQPLAITDENFPALGPESTGAGISKTVNLSVSSSNKQTMSGAQCQTNNTSNVSIQVNHEPNGVVTTRVSGPNIRIRPAQRSMDADFPALNPTEPSTSGANAAHWREVLQWTCSKSLPATVPKSKKVAPPPLAPMVGTSVQLGEDFPSLSKPSKAKRQSTISVTPTWVHPQPSNSHNSGNNTAKAASDSTKGKTKKKKAKQNSSGNTSSGNESSSSKSNVNTKNVKRDESKKTNNDTKKKESTTTKAQTSTLESSGVVNDERISEPSSTKENESSKKEGKSKKEKKKSKNNSTDENSLAGTVEIVCPDSSIGTSNGIQRKRTELKIDSLNSANNNILQTNDFPALGGGGTKPPGFTNPPPGFSSYTPPPPPGFVKLNSVQRPQSDNGLTFTNSSGESYSIFPDNDKRSNEYAYMHPPDFQKRNKCLVAKVSEVLNQQDQIAEFRYFNGLFRQGTYSAEDYYKRCREVMGLSTFESLFPELLVLLPDISKQQDLYKVHKKEMNGKIRGLEICPTCGQVLKSGADIKGHVANHTLENHFPALGKGTTAQPASTWVRK